VSRSGFLRKAVAAPLRTHDLRHAAAMHAGLAPGDVLVGDRAFGSYAHLALCRSRGLHAVFRLHQRRPRGRRRDRLVAYRKPPARERPAWLSEAAYAALPEALVVREVRVRVGTPGGRTRVLTLVTTLLNRRRYPARALAALYGARWGVETNLRHLKQSLGLDVLRGQTFVGVMKEVAMFVVAYNLVRRVMAEAARRQGVSPGRISFVDALRWLRCARPGEEVPRLRVNPERPGRHEPRVRKRRPKQYNLMRRPRKELREKLFKKRQAA
jgi:Transposase DDE domain